MYKKQNMFLKNLPPDNIPRNNAFYALKNPLFFVPPNTYLSVRRFITYCYGWSMITAYSVHDKMARQNKSYRIFQYDPLTRSQHVGLLHRPTNVSILDLLMSMEHNLDFLRNSCGCQ